MARTVQYSSSPLGDASPAGEQFTVFLRDEDDDQNPLTGRARVYVRYRIRVTGDDGSESYEAVTRQLNAVPNGIWSEQVKQGLWDAVKDGHAAARAVATGD